MIQINKEKIKNKLNNLTKKQKVLVIVLLLAIFLSLFYFATFDKITTITYSRFGKVICEETYVNGKLNSTPCPVDEIKNNRLPWQLEID